MTEEIEDENLLPEDLFDDDYFEETMASIEDSEESEEEPE